MKLKGNPRYFADESGKTWIPIGCNICFDRLDCVPTPEANEAVDCYLPWEDRRVTVAAPTLPPFKRSIVVRVPADAVEGVVRPH